MVLKGTMCRQERNGPCNSRKGPPLVCAVVLCYCAD